MKTPLSPLPAALMSLALAACSGGAYQVTDKPRRVVPEWSQSTYDSTHYAQAVVAGDEVYVSGVTGTVYEGEDAVYKQFDDAFARLQETLQEAGSSLSQVKEIYSWHVDLHKHARTFLQVKDEYFPATPYPTWSSMEASELAPGALLEVVARATRKESGSLQRLSLPDKQASQIRFTPAVVDDDLVYLSGLSGEFGSPENQFRTAFERLKYELEAANSSLDDLIELEIFVVDLPSNAEVLQRIKEEFITGHPVYTLVGIKGLIFPEGLIEITVRARHSDSAQALQPLFMPQSWPAHPAAMRFGDTLYLAPLSALPPNLSREAQFDDIFKRLREVLKAAGAGFDDVVELNTHHVGLQAHFSDFLPVKDRYLKAPYPAWNAIGVESLPAPGAEVAVSARVVVPR